MIDTKCDHCTGLACGDKCDGKSHATTPNPDNREKIMDASELVRAIRYRNTGHWGLSRKAAIRLVTANYAARMESRKDPRPDHKVGEVIR
jgi:hypothetical protein